MIDQSRLLLIHGLAGNSRGYKATLLRGLFPQMIIPDFAGEFAARMAHLYALIGDTANWTIIGSSLGGLMATAYAVEAPTQVSRLVLLAPALPWYDRPIKAQLDLPVTIYHGLRDDVVSLPVTRQIAEQLFRNLNFHEVDDDHGLSKTVDSLDWPALLDS